MDASAELEINLRRFDVASYVVDLRFSLSSSDSDIRPDRRSPLVAHFDLAGLLALTSQPDEYGALLTQSLFASDDVRAIYHAACGAALAQSIPLRVRLGIDVGSPELHALRWELLRDPQTDVPLCMNETIRFTRYLGSNDWRQTRIRAKEALRALVLIAHPSDLPDYQLQPFDWAAERDRLLAALGTLPSTLLLPGQASLDHFEAQLRQSPDIVIIMAHGAMRGEPLLWLEDEHGRSAPTSAGQLELLLRTVEQPPRFVVLSSCQGAGGEYDDTVTALAPRLASAGVPAIIGMRGQISIETASKFQQTLVEELLRDGQIDRAVAAARRAVRQRPDAWMPILFSRLKSGRLWYVPRFGDDPQGFQRWPTLKTRISNGTCTPILGPGVYESILGSTREIARQWAEAYSFPLQPHDREDLPQVAQYLMVNQDAQFVREKLGEYLRNELLRRFGDGIPPELQAAQPGMLDAMLTAVSGIIHQRNTVEAHTVLAKLPFPLYVTTNADSLLESALRSQGKTPHATLCPWNDEVRRNLVEYDDQPTADHPLVYHMFGMLQEPASVVLAEDDYFSFLINATRNTSFIPDVVKAALADTTLLFLGFRLDDWHFRVLFQILMSLEGRSRRRRLTHVAVQIDPEEGQIISPDRARKYLEDYFEDADISIYWGSVDDFIAELQRQIPTGLNGSPLEHARRTPL